MFGNNEQPDTEDWATVIEVQNQEIIAIKYIVQ
jgi:hypothetical protein